MKLLNKQLWEGPLHKAGARVYLQVNRQVLWQVYDQVKGQVRVQVSWQVLDQIYGQV